MKKILSAATLLAILAGQAMAARLSPGNNSPMPMDPQYLGVAFDNLHVLLENYGVGRNDMRGNISNRRRGPVAFLAGNWVNESALSLPIEIQGLEVTPLTVLPMEQAQGQKRGLVVTRPGIMPLWTVGDFFDVTHLPTQGVEPFTLGPRQDQSFRYQAWPSKAWLNIFAKQLAQGVEVNASLLLKVGQKFTGRVALPMTRFAVLR